MHSAQLEKAQSKYIRRDQSGRSSINELIESGRIGYCSAWIETDPRCEAWICDFILSEKLPQAVDPNGAKLAVDSKIDI